MVTVASYIAYFLKKNNIDHVFGYQGSAMLKMLDEIVGTGISYIQNFHEQASGFAADSYARINGTIGVAVATSGPGAVNMIGGISDAYFDSVPVLFITGQDYLKNLTADNGARQNGFQDMDIVSMVKPITKYAVMLREPQMIRYELEKAFHFAVTGRKGPVLIDVPIDLQFQEIDETVLQGYIPDSKKDVKSNLTDSVVDTVIRLVENSQKPVILVGGGIRGADAVDELNTFIYKTKIPAVSTLNGLDATSETIGFTGIYGNTEANLALKNADLVLALGTRFAQQHTGKTKDLYNGAAKVIHVDIDRTEIGRTFMKPTIGIVADLLDFLRAVNQKSIHISIDKWLCTIQRWKQKYGDTICRAKKLVDPVLLVREVSRYASEDTIFTSDVGANQMWVAQGISLKPGQRLLNSSGFGSMGFSLPAAIGATYLKPLAVAFMGDGGFQMNIQELNTLSIRRNNVKCFIFNNNNLALMRNLQKNYYSNHFYGNNENEFCCPDIKKLADTFNLQYLLLGTNEDLVKIKEVLLRNGPCLVDVRMDIDLTPLTKFEDEAFNNG